MTVEGPEILFTVELEDIAGPRFRLQKDGSWWDTRKDRTLRESDLTTTSPEEVPALDAQQGALEIQGVIYDIDADRWPTEHDQLHNSSLVFRRHYPKEPSVEQLKEVIALGDDSVDNVPILNVYGKFELRQSPPFNQLLNDPSVVIRHEATITGNGYVGREASRDMRLIDLLYVSSLEQWKNHLKYHVTQEFSDTGATETVEEIRKELKEIERNWRPYN